MPSCLLKTPAHGSVNPMRIHNACSVTRMSGMIESQKKVADFVLKRIYYPDITVRRESVITAKHLPIIRRNHYVRVAVGKQICHAETRALMLNIDRIVKVSSQWFRTEYDNHGFWLASETGIFNVQIIFFVVICNMHYLAYCKFSTKVAVRY